jgi:hypothetical protein
MDPQPSPIGPQGKPACAHEMGQHEPGEQPLVQRHDPLGYAHTSPFTTHSPATGSLMGQAHGAKGLAASQPPSPASNAPPASGRTLDPEPLPGALPDELPEPDPLPLPVELPEPEAEPLPEPTRPSTRLGFPPSTSVESSSAERAPQPPAYAPASAPKSMTKVTDLAARPILVGRQHTPRARRVTRAVTGG